MSFSPLEYRRLLSRYASGITVVTTIASDGSFHGITVNSFTSVSLDPPLVLICIDKKTESHKYLLESQFFCANILHENQESVSTRFAGKDKPFHDILTHPEVTGAPVLNDSLGFVDCQIVNTYEGGDHTIFIGQVVKLGFLDVIDASGHERGPLLYFKSKYQTLTK